jgi:hypothetical protein
LDFDHDSFRWRRNKKRDLLGQAQWQWLQPLVEPVAPTLQPGDNKDRKIDKKLLITMS